MFYDGYHIWGMHLIWWFVWIMLIFWVFATPYSVPGIQKTKNSPLNILKRRYAAGEISADEYNERKKNIEAV